MNEVGTILDKLLRMAKKDESVRQALLKTRRAEDPVSAFCEYARSLGFELYEMDLVEAGEDWTELMQKGINGGGTNHTVLYEFDDFYEQFFAAIK
ncbi:MAG: hypothetical protein ACOYJJ_05540 [Anaerovoracaceae bacterium]|jgi:hypothetical protein